MLPEVLPEEDELVAADELAAPPVPVPLLAPLVEPEALPVLAEVEAPLGPLDEASQPPPQTPTPSATTPRTGPIARERFTWQRRARRSRGARRGGTCFR